MAATAAEALRLVLATDADFAWMRGEISSPSGLRLADGVTDRDILANTRVNGSNAGWLMVADEEVVGLCGFRSPPGSDGGVEIGYSVAELRRGRGYATRAIALFIEWARADRAIRRLSAGTAPDNIASHKVLQRNGFEIVGRYVDPKYGDSVRWQRNV